MVHGKNELLNLCYNLWQFSFKFIENDVKILFDLKETNLKYPLRLWMDQMPTEEQVRKVRLL